MADNNAGTLELVAVQISRFFSPLREVLQNESGTALFVEFGVQFPLELDVNPSFREAMSTARAQLNALPSLANQLLRAVDAGEFDLSLFEDLREAVQGATSGLGVLPDTLDELAASGEIPGFSAAEIAEFTSGLSTRLLEWTAVNYLEAGPPMLAAVLDLFGVIERTEEQVGSTDPRRPQYTKRALHLEKLPRALLTPFGALRDLYGFGDADFDGLALFARLESILSRIGVPVLNEPTATPPKLDLIFGELSVYDDVSPPGLALLLKAHFDAEFEVERPPLTLGAIARLDVPLGTGVTLQPNLAMGLTSPSLSTVEGELRLTIEMTQPDPPVVLIGRAEGSRLEIGGLSLDTGVTLVWDAATASARGDFSVGAEVRQVRLVIEPPAGDGFLAAIFPANGVDSRFDMGVRLGSSGFVLTGSASLEIVLPLHLDLGVASVDAVTIGIKLEGDQLSVPVGALVRGQFGPVDVVVDGIGLKADFTFPGQGGNLGPVDASIAPRFPTGAGISVDAGAVRGGGFLTFGDARYAGAIELTVFSVVVKAFGLIETRLPDGSPGFSFVIVISAEFTPIQLGFGFTLVAIGGLLGLNRSVNEQGLADAVRTGSLAHLLFPKNPVQDAPAIIHDLATVFPAARGHFIVGPMAKLGWGTPTLITADLGIVIEFPGPRLAVLGVVRMLLPSPEFALMRFQLAVAGVLDFPARTFALDASLFDSTVAGYVVTGDMAYRLGFGANAAFLLSVGGFNPGFQSPPAFPELRRASVDLGVSGNPSLVASGYFALTSNTAQVGAKIELKASGYGIRLNGHLGFDVLFVFSPFSFTASISAGVRVSFHGVGLGITLRGSLSGPTPWHVKGRVCVSVLWWDACLPIDVKFGRAEPAALPEMDPWEGTPEVTPPEEVDPRILVLGLRDAIVDPRNWSGSAPPAGFSVVSLAEAASAERTPIDPLGAATLRQKVVPLKRELEKFGEYKPIGHTLFDSVVVAINDVPEDNIAFVEDDFAPAHFTEFSGAERLSMPSYEKMDAGFSIAPDRVTQGTVGSAKLEYETAFITAAGERFVDQPGDVKFKLTHEQLVAQLERSASALGGIRRSGTQRYMLPLDREKKVVLARETFVVADSCSHVKHGATGTYKSRSQALLALRAHVRATPTDVNRFSVVPEFAAA